MPLRRATQHRVDARQQLARRERLGDVVIGAAVETHDLVLLFSARGQHDDRHFLGLLVALQRARQLEAAHVRQHPVDQHQIGALIGNAGARRAHIGRFAHFEAAAAQSECNHFADRPLVFDDQDLLGCHVTERFNGDERRCQQHYSNGLLQSDESRRRCGKYRSRVLQTLYKRDLVAQIDGLRLARGHAAPGAELGLAEQRDLARARQAPACTRQPRSALTSCG